MAKFKSKEVSLYDMMYNADYQKKVVEPLLDEGYFIPMDAKVKLLKRSKKDDGIERNDNNTEES